MQSLPPRIRQLALDASALERKYSAQATMLSAALDIYSELYEWACETADTESSQQVLGILEKFQLIKRKPRQGEGVEGDSQALTTSEGAR